MAIVMVTEEERNSFFRIYSSCSGHEVLGRGEEGTVGEVGDKSEREEGDGRGGREGRWGGG